MSNLLLDPIELSLTTVGGASSANTPRIYGMCRLVYVNPATSTTEWDIKLTDYKNRVIYHKRDETGVLRDYVSFPVKGIYTVDIENASADEAFTLFFQIGEEQ